jgi:histidinol-phosphatase
MAAARGDAARFLPVALSAVAAAGDLTRRMVARGFTTGVKADGSFVTSVDTAVEKLIRREIGAAFPDHAVTGEEFGSRGDAEYRWLVDPIDGTLAFRSGLPFYGTILVLCRGEEPIVAVIAHPAWDVTYHAVRGGGAFRNGRRIRLRDVSAAAVPGEIIGTGDRYQFRKSGALGRYERLVKRHRIVRTIPDCVGHTLAAEGRIGAMVDYFLHRWDHAGTELLIREAGGKFVLTGSRTLPDGAVAHDMICGKPRVVDWLCREFFA